MQPTVSIFKTILTRLLLVLVCVAGIILAFVIWNIFSVYRADQKVALTKDAQNTFMQGDFSQANNSAEKVAQISPDVSPRAHNVQSQSLVMSNDPEDHLKAFAIIKEDFASQDRVVKSAALGRLIDLLVRNRDNKIYTAVFHDPTFAPYKGGGLQASVRKLARAASLLSPTVYNQYWQAWYSNATATTTEVLQKRADTSLALLKAGDVLFDAKKRAISDTLSPFEILFLYFIRGRMYEGVGMTYPDIAHSEALSSYIQGEKYYDSLGVNPPPVAELRMPYLYISHAHLLATTPELTNRTTIDTLLQKVQTMLTSDPSIHEHGYVAIIRRVAKGESLTQDGDYKILKDLATVSPTFKTFVESYGVSFAK